MIVTASMFSLATFPMDYDSFSEIKDILVNNGMTLFDGDGDDL